MWEKDRRVGWGVGVPGGAQWGWGLQTLTAVVGQKLGIAGMGVPRCSHGAPGRAPAHGPVTPGTHSRDPLPQPAPHPNPTRSTSPRMHGSPSLAHTAPARTRTHRASTLLAPTSNTHTHAHSRPPAPTPRPPAPRSPAPLTCSPLRRRMLGSSIPPRRAAASRCSRSARCSRCAAQRPRHGAARHGGGWERGGRRGGPFLPDGPAQ